MKVSLSLLVLIISFGCMTQKKQVSGIDPAQLNTSESSLRSWDKAFVLKGATEVGIDIGKVNIRQLGTQGVEIYNHQSKEWIGLAMPVNFENPQMRNEAMAVSNCSANAIIKINFNFKECTPHAKAERNGIDVCETDSDGDCTGGGYTCREKAQNLKMTKEGCTPYHESISLSDKDPIEVMRKEIGPNCNNPKK